MAPDGEIWIICGNSCAGKSTTADVLASRLPLAARIDGDDLQRLIVSGCRWGVLSDCDPVTGRLTGEAGMQWRLRIRNACVLAASFADAGITAVVTDSIVEDAFDEMVDVLRGRTIHFVVLRPSLAVLRQRGIDRLPYEAEFLAERYGGSTEHPEAAELAAKLKAAAAGLPTNEFDELLEQSLDRLPSDVGLRLDPGELAPHDIADLVLARRADAAWTVTP